MFLPPPDQGGIVHSLNFFVFLLSDSRHCTLTKTARGAQLRDTSSQGYTFSTRSRNQVHRTGCVDRTYLSIFTLASFSYHHCFFSTFSFRTHEAMMRLLWLANTEMRSKHPSFSLTSLNIYYVLQVSASCFQFPILLKRNSAVMRKMRVKMILPSRSLFALLSPSRRFVRQILSYH